MDLPSHRKVLLSDPLSDVTRRERRTFLGTATVAILIAETGLVPSKIDALGIELTAVDQSTFLLILSLVVAYFFCAFAVYGIMELVSWWHSYQEYIVDRDRELKRVDEEAWDDDDAICDEIPGSWWISNWSKPIAFIRLFFEFGIPVLVGVYAIVRLIAAAANA